MDDKTTLTRSEKTHIEVCVRKLYDAVGPPIRGWSCTVIVNEILRQQGVKIPVEKWDALAGYVRAEVHLIDLERGSND